MNPSTCHTCHGMGYYLVYSINPEDDPVRIICTHAGSTVEQHQPTYEDREAQNVKELIPGVDTQAESQF